MEIGYHLTLTFWIFAIDEVATLQRAGALVRTECTQTMVQIASGWAGVSS